MRGQARAMMRHSGLPFFAGITAAVGSGSQAFAQALAPSAPVPVSVPFLSMTSTSIGALVLACGFLVLGVAAGVMLVNTRKQAQKNEAQLQADLNAVRAKLDRVETLLAAESHILVTFGSAGEEPEVSGDLAARIMLPAGRRILGFGTWLAPEDVTRLEQLVDGLRERGEAFHITVPTKRGSHVGIDGRAIAGRAIMRIRDMTGEKLALAELEAQHGQIQNDVQKLQSLLNQISCPAWLRDKIGNLIWVNQSYAHAVEAKTQQEAVEKKLELLDQPARQEAIALRAKGQAFKKRTAAVVAGQRKLLDVLETASENGGAGFAIDVSEQEEVRNDLGRRIDAHRKTLDELATAVAIFSASGALVFYNQAYCQLWHLDPAFLDQSPSDTTILDRLRADRHLPEQADFRTWKSQIHEAYHTLESREHWWYLPDSRTLRVVQTPNPEGGVTYLFDDVSERINLESRYNALIHVQSETLDHLQEGVAVFGSDGRLKLHNPAFANLWKFDAETLKAHPHADRLLELCRQHLTKDDTWATLKTSITALQDRAPVAFINEREDGIVLNISTVPLPDGGTLITFIDITATVMMERALRERNEALEQAAQVKTDFVKHVSYELRSPLTNIIGFTQLLGDTNTGPLTKRQEEYAGHILDSSAALLAIINDILDLATIDAGAMELNLGDVDIKATMNGAAEGVKDRLTEASITLDIQASDTIGTFRADEKRIRQILFNLLSNAIGFSPEGGTVRLEGERRNDAIVFRVSDNGCGMTPEIAARIFDRFESHTQGSRHRGVGLGLSIVRSFVELHGGTVTLESKPNEGTAVTCVFPLVSDTSRIAAE